jgi:hypothetical protein
MRFHNIVLAFREYVETRILIQVRICLGIASTFLAALVILRMSNAVHGVTMLVIADILEVVSIAIYISIFYFLHQDKKTRNGDASKHRG